MSAFHYCVETPTESTFSDIQALNKFTDDQFRRLLSTVITVLVEPGKSAWLVDQLEEFSQQYNLNITSLKNVNRNLLNVLKGALKQNLDARQVKEDFTLLGLNEDKASYLSEQWLSNQAAMWRCTLDQTLSVNRLVDMDWKFGVTAASSELSKVANTFLQLKLVIDKGHGMEDVYMELTLPQFYSFLHEMEKARSVIDHLS
jgi:hypothetical protein